MGIEGEEEKEEKPEIVKPPVEKPKKSKPLKIKAEPIESKVKKVEVPELEVEVPQESLEKKEKIAVKKEEWFEPEGQLAIDVYQTENDLVIQSAIAGVKSEDLDISIEGDVITIKGKRENPIAEGGDYFIKECYWGPFSRQLILPVEVDPNRVEALMKEGILIIKMPKIEKERKRKIVVKE